MNNHLNSVGESYIHHFFSAIKITIILFWCGILNIIHALIPDFFSDNVTKTCEDILDKRYSKEDYKKLF